MIYAKIWTSEQFGKISDKAKLLYIGMITLADDDGRLRGNPLYLRSQIFTYNDMPLDEVKQLRDEIVSTGLINVYTVDNFEYIEHPKWEEYQTIRKDLYSPSSLPPRHASVTDSLRKSTLSKDKLSKDKVRDIYTPKFEKFWSLYPKKVGKKNAFEQWKKLTDAERNKTLDDIPKRSEDDKWVNGYIKDPERYLKNRQWEDEIIRPRAEKKPERKVDNFKTK